ncbi:MAG TPA: UDP-N-acetylmuramate dehydrogenase [Steroidobacteraceae bacterium]|nr:UDP-N-acetylmuramate dehydrogenase [Steroidobacteraceae bacterium]
MNAVAVSSEYSGRVVHNEPMSRHTSWHVGGPAETYFEPRDAEDLAAFLRGLPAGTPLHWIGLGSNVLVRDGGLRGVVISTHGTLDDLERTNETQIRGGAGVACARLAKQCVKWGLGPAEFFAGIPGTLGGALAMNAGAFGGETWRHVVEVETIDRSGARRTRAASEFRVGYRSVVAPAEEWFISARLQFEHRPEAHQDEIRNLLARRKESQPIGAWSGGSTFTNPVGDHAARLIDSAGLKGYRIGGASVSAKHANFLLNEGEATARDLEQLILHVQRTVERVHGVRLETEVRIMGEAA